MLPDGPLAGVREILAGYDPATPATRSAPHPVTGPAGTLEAVVVPSAVGPHVVLLRPRAGDQGRLAALGLTPRQCQVAVELATGATGEQIAQRLGITPATVRKHLEAVFARLGVTHRAAAVARVRSLLDGAPTG